MPTSAFSTDKVQFGVFELDMQRGELRKNGIKVRLQEQPLTILRALIDRPGQIVTREDLRALIWPANTFVEFDQGLYSAMARLRDALGDTAENPRFVQTVARRGYRFIAPVSELPAGSTKEPIVLIASGAESARTTPRISITFTTIILLCAVITLIIFGTLHRLRTNSPIIRSIAVLPLENLSGDPEQEYFADSMTDELITTLAKLKNLRVVSRTSIMRYRKTDKSLPQIGRELDADAVIEGTVEPSVNRMRIRIQLIQTSTDQHLWAQTYDEDLQDTLLLQSQVASDIAREIQSSLSPQEQLQLPETRNVDPEAHRSYLKGLYFFNKHTNEGTKRAIEFYSQAVARQRDYALAYAGLSESYLEQYWAHVDQDAVRDKATAAALRSAQLNPDLAEAHLALGDVRETLQWDWSGAEAEYKRAIDLNPNSAVARQDYAILLTMHGDFDHARTQAQQSQDIDPVSPFIRTTFCLLLRFAHRYDDALQKCREALDLEPAFTPAHRNLARVYEAKGDSPKAVGEFLSAFVLEGKPQSQIEELRKAQAASGMQGFWRAMVKQERSAPNPDPYRVAECYSRLQQNDLALKWLETAYAQHSPHLWALNSEESFINIRSDPRFHDLQRRLHLVP